LQCQQQWSARKGVERISLIVIQFGSTQASNALIFLSQGLLRSSKVLIQQLSCPSVENNAKGEWVDAQLIKADKTSC